MSNMVTALPYQALAAKVPTDHLPFKTLKDIEPLSGILGQERAVEAIQFGVAMQRPGYNIYAMGDSGTGRSSYVMSYLKSEAKRRSAPTEWVYVNNFTESYRPKAIEFAPDMASEFEKEIRGLIDGLMATFPAAFENPTYQQQKSIIDRAFNDKYEAAINRVERVSGKIGVAMFRDASSVSFAPMKEGKALEENEFAALTDEERDAFQEGVSTLEGLLNEELLGLPQWKRETYDLLRQLNLDTVKEALDPLMQPLLESYQEHEQVTEYLSALRADLDKTIIDQMADDKASENRDEVGRRQMYEDLYLPNIAVTNEKDGGQPVIYEPHPTYRNLFGQVEHSSDQGMLVTSYRLIRSGSLHAANGGYLILDAEKLLTDHYLWEALKRALKSKTLKIEHPYSDMGLMNTTTLTPQDLPLQVKVVLIGARDIYYLLQDADPDFQEMFRVLVDFDDSLKRTKDSEYAFARLMKDRVDKEEYANVTRDGVAALIEYSSRLAEHQREMAAKIGDVFELLGEADFVRQMAKDGEITADHIQRALKAKKHRTGRVSEKIIEEIIEGTVLLESDGYAVGKINGLTVMQIGDSSFGAPARISTTVYPGGKGIIDIERESNLGQNIHSKGVLILSGYLGNKYAQRFPLEISASIAMEQSYGYVDGDSASTAELCCLLSALIQVPLRQDLAITGSLNQYGEVQAIGGVNEKIEGFFNVCRARELTGKQGVIVPKSNANNLMLNDDILEAVKAGLFHIYVIESADEALHLLTGIEPGVPDENGDYKEGTLSFKVIQRLEEIAKLGEDEEEEDDDNDESDESTEANTKKG
ncbi:Lon protease family protein [Marinomonas posidonica]|uniref:endopeptidase La n=1 Tax=Marinomonas posidonica (strain CECT 7376 / NCIMB 14433 / IVIA-Po-181) TaxID=491952 RepID=F6CZZ4_MARPP|nr:ATP-binding protein [Marinomonas posidonica]AEF54734.1 ATP-dependent protease, putative [Marinomonas posidonica IVIA-Po-181]